MLEKLAVVTEHDGGPCPRCGAKPIKVDKNWKCPHCGVDPFIKENDDEKERE